MKVNYPFKNYQESFDVALKYGNIFNTINEFLQVSYIIITFMSPHILGHWYQELYYSIIQDQLRATTYFKKTIKVLQLFIALKCDAWRIIYQRSAVWLIAEVKYRDNVRLQERSEKGERTKKRA